MSKTQAPPSNKKVGSDLLAYHNHNAPILESKALALGAGYVNSKGEGNYNQYREALFTAMNVPMPKKSGRKSTLKPLNEEIIVKLQKNGNLSLSRAFIGTLGVTNDAVTVTCLGDQIVITTANDFVNSSEDDEDYEDDEEDEDDEDNEEAVLASLETVSV